MKYYINWYKSLKYALQICRRGGEVYNYFDQTFVNNIVGLFHKV